MKLEVSGYQIKLDCQAEFRAGGLLSLITLIDSWLSDGLKAGACRNSGPTERNNTRKSLVLETLSHCSSIQELVVPSSSRIPIFSQAADLPRDKRPRNSGSGDSSHDAYSYTESQATNLPSTSGQGADISQLDRGDADARRYNRRVQAMIHSKNR